MCDRFVDSFWVVLRSAQSVVEHMSQFRLDLCLIIPGISAESDDTSQLTVQRNW